MKLGTMIAAVVFGISLSACVAPSGRIYQAAPAPAVVEGASCTEATQCGCWECICKRVSGDPGGAQLCIEGRCPTGVEACTAVCAIAGAQFEEAVAIAGHMERWRLAKEARQCGGE